MSQIRSSLSWGIAPLLVGVLAPSLGCSSKAEKQTYDPVPLGMVSTDAPFYDDGETTIYQVKRPVSLPIILPNDDEMKLLGQVAVSPWARTPWITKNDVKVQVTWTVSNLDKEGHNIELLLDPWTEFARYVPGVNVGEEETIPDLSGIDLLTRIEGLQRKTGIFTFDDMDEAATDLATAQNILLNMPPMPADATASGDYGGGANGMINHAFEIHNRSSDNDKLIKYLIPPTVAGLVGFDIGLRAFDKANVAIEIVVEIVDVPGNRVNADQALKLDGTMWMTPEATVTAPMGNVR
jgi:hypothetical protein